MATCRILNECPRPTLWQRSTATWPDLTWKSSQQGSLLSPQLSCCAKPSSKRASFSVLATNIHSPYELLSTHSSKNLRQSLCYRTLSWESWRARSKRPLLALGELQAKLKGWFMWSSRILLGLIKVAFSFALILPKRALVVGQNSFYHLVFLCLGESTRTIWVSLSNKC